MAPTPPLPPPDIVYAGFVRRWAALLVDKIIVTVPLLGSIVLLFIVGPDDEDRGSAMLLGLLLLWLVGVALYYAGMESSRHQATFGKRAFRIKVTDNAGQRLSFVQALGRWFAAALSYLTFCLGFLTVAFTQRKRALHDIVASTLVLDRWAYSEHPERQQSNAFGSLVAAVIAICLVLAVIAIFAGVANSEYETFVIRSQVSEGVSLAAGPRTAVEEYYHDEGHWPASNEAARVESASISGRYVSEVLIQDGRIVAVFSSKRPHKANSDLDRKQLVWVPAISPHGSVVWTCSSKIANKYLPSNCRSAARQ